MALLDGIVVTLALAIGGLRFGANIGYFLRHGIRHGKKDTIYGFSKVSGRHAVPFLQCASIILGIGSWIGAVLMTIFQTEWRGVALFAVTFSPAGAILRWYLARKLNSLYPSFPIGTFTANIFGTILIGCFSIAQQRAADYNSATACQVLQGLSDGFCGCLTTVSTFVLELQTLERRHAWRYGAASVCLGIIGMCLTTGVDNWRFRKHVQLGC